MLYRILLYCGLMTIMMVGGISQSFAGSYKVTPTKLKLDYHHPIVNLEVTHASAQPRRNETALFQVTGLAWIDQRNKLSVAQTKDLLISPRIFRLQPNQRQTVRIGLKDRRLYRYRKAYRLIVQELPARRSANEKVDSTIAFNVPLYLN